MRLSVEAGENNASWNDKLWLTCRVGEKEAEEVIPSFDLSFGGCCSILKEEESDVESSDEGDESEERTVLVRWRMFPIYDEADLDPDQERTKPDRLVLECEYVVE
jgi:hypothetical protein